MEWGEAREEEVVDGGQLITRQPATSGGSIRLGHMPHPGCRGQIKQDGFKPPKETWRLLELPTKAQDNRAPERRRCLKVHRLPYTKT